jgi:hypothetical protein
MAIEQVAIGHRIDRETLMRILLDGSCIGCGDRVMRRRDQRRTRLSLRAMSA